MTTSITIKNPVVSDFLQGALNGLQIGAFNFVEHDGYEMVMEVLDM